MKTKWESRPCEFADLAERAVSRRWAAFSALLALTFIKDFSSDSILQIEEFIALTSLKLCRPPPGRRPENLCQCWAFLNLIRRRVNIKFSAPSKIKLRSLP